MKDCFFIKTMHFHHAVFFAVATHQNDWTILTGIKN